MHQLIFIFLTVNLFLTCDSIFFPVQPADSQSEEFADVHKYANDEVTRDEVAQGIKLSLHQRLLVNIFKIVYFKEESFKLNNFNYS